MHHVGEMYPQESYISTFVRIGPEIASAGPKAIAKSGIL